MAAAAVWRALLALGPAALAAEVSPVDQENRRCFNCHGQAHIVDLTPAERRSMVAPTTAPATGSQGSAARPSYAGVRQGLYLGPDALKGSHAKLTCVSCHTDAKALLHPAQLAPVTCDASGCHAPEAAKYRQGAHAQALARGDARAPTCAACHGGHDILPKSDRKSRVYPLNVVGLCADCHRQHRDPTPNGGSSHANVQDYMASVHGQAVIASGLVVAATCADCHRAHDVLPSRDAGSSVSRGNVPATCSKCHVGVAETFARSIHGRALARGGEAGAKAPVCSDCHTAHRISHAGTSEFLRDLVSECGQCHDQPPPTDPGGVSLYQTYQRSYHGQVTALGSSRAARCSDCHGAHDIQPAGDRASRVHPDNRVATCAQAGCHPGANARFAQFQPHADHRNRGKYPLLHAVWLYFVIVMSGTFLFFGVHSGLWMGRALVHRLRHGPPAHAARGPHIKRFGKTDRVNHALVIVSFFGLTLTGMPLFFADQAWARALAGFFGGAHNAGLLHRLFALMLMVNVAIHAAGVIRRFRRNGLRQSLFGPTSLLPRWKDVTDCLAMFRWFFGGPQPRFDHWTYWEKFDYWAEIFGTGVIGITGLMLWFPMFFSQFLPGWMFNVATIVHGYEALLAVGFIFTIHFFAAHLRPEKFPVDAVMFTGTMPETELAHERPEEYARLQAAGRLEQLRAPPPPAWQRRLAVAAGVLAMAVGTTMVVLIVLAGLSAI